MVTEEATGDSAVKKKTRQEYYVRFGTGQRIEHAVLMVTFIALALTGLAQRYYTAGWAEWLIAGLGGIAYTRLVHRAFALLFTLSALYHLGYIFYSYFIRRRKLTMIPTIKDFRDVVGSLRYIFGFIGKPPQFGRYDYRQKFEYWGLIIGSVVITLTGYILAFPITVTRFLPGQVVAAALVIHGYEATLAVLTIVIWHLYDVIFRPGVFPADISIFTGKISRQRMLEEHSLELAEQEAAADNPDTGPPPGGEAPADSPGR